MFYESFSSARINLRELDTVSSAWLELVQEEQGWPKSITLGNGYSFDCVMPYVIKFNDKIFTLWCIQ